MSDKKFTTHGNEPIEARIVAWVLGEASAFEADELERLCEEQPELAVFKRRIEAVHGLVEQAHDRSDDARWKLSNKKRAAIEELIGAQEQAAADLARDQRAGRSGRRALLAIAACLVMTLVVATLTWPIIFKRSEIQIVNYTADSETLFMEGAEMDDVLPSADYLLDGNGESVRYKALPHKTSNGNHTTNLTLGGKEELKELEGLATRRSMTLNDEALKPQAADEYELASGGIGNSDKKRGEAEPAEKFDAPADVAGSDKWFGDGKYLNGLGGGGGNAQDPGSDVTFTLPGRGRTPNALPAPKVAAPPAAPEAAETGTSTYYAYRKSEADAGKKGSAEGERPESKVPKETALKFSKDNSPYANEKRLDETKSRLQRDAAYNKESLREVQAMQSNAPQWEATSATVELFKQGQGQDQADLQSRLNRLNGPSLEGFSDEDKLKVLKGRELIEKSGLLHATEIELGDNGIVEDEEALIEEVDQIKAVVDERKRPVVTGEEIIAADEPYSTFSLNINDASFRVAQAALNRGEMPDPEGIKVEQFYNAVDYGDPSPAKGQPVAGKIEQTAHPIIPGRNLVRVAIKTASEGRNQGQPLRLTLLIDQSGSMAREDRRQAMVDALEGLRGLLTEKDQVNVIGFSRTPRLLAEGVNGKEGQLANLVNIEANEGGTNLEMALQLGEQLAERHQLEGAQNRLVLFTDGAANLGDADPDSLADKIKELRQKGIAFDIAGIVADGLNDDLLGEMARHGNGRYYVVGKGQKDRFAQQLAGAFRPAAENVKVQVHFNPERVGRYKLIGFEKDRLNKEDFHDDTVDAAELAAEEAGVAIYQVETLPEGEGEIGEVSVRFRDVASGNMVERSWTISNEIATPALDQARPSMQLATLAMLAGEKLKGGPLADAVNFNDMGEVIAQVNQHYKGDPKAAEMLQMIEQLK